MERKKIRERVVEQFRNIDETFAREVAGSIGVAVPARRPSKSPKPEQPAFKGRKRAPEASPTLSIANTVKDSIRSRCVAVLAADGASAADIKQLRTALTREGARMEVGIPGPLLLAFTCASTALRSDCARGCRHGYPASARRAISCVETSSGAEEIVAKNVLLATGVCDIEPRLPNLERAVRQGYVRHCAICDRFGVIFRNVVGIGHDTAGLKEALFPRTYTARLTLLTLGEPMSLRPLR